MAFVVLLGGTDISTRVLSTIRVERGERVAALASFQYSPSSTPLLPLALIRKSVVISWEGTTIFTGQVNNAVWRPGARVFEISASDMFQEYWESRSEEEILTDLPGALYSVNLHGAREDGWQQAQDCLGTVRVDAHLDEVGALEVVDWAAKATPDFYLTAGDILYDGAYDLNMVSGRDLITRYNLTYQYRISRWQARIHVFAWGTAIDFCDWLHTYHFTYPTRDAIYSAAQGTGWDIVTDADVAGSSTLSLGYSLPDDYPGVQFGTLPQTGPVCDTGSGPIVWVIDEEYRLSLATSAGWRGVKRWAQTITETYNITLDASTAQASVGVLVAEESASYAPETDDSSFEQGAKQDLTPWSLNGLDDYYEDQEDEDQRVIDLEAEIERGITQMHEVFRRSELSVSTRITPTLNLSHTVDILTDDIHARGKVRKVEHVIDQNRAVTNLTLALSNGGGGTQESYGVPDRPDSQPTHEPPDSSTSLGTYIGGCANSALYDQDWEGWTTNMAQSFTFTREEDDGMGGTVEVEHTVTRPGCPSPGDPPGEGQMYPLRFKVTGPDIESEARDEVQVSQDVTIDIAIPDDILVLY